MLSTGNAKTEVCAANLLKIIRYEVPYDRIKGLPAEIIDMPIDEAAVTFTEAATWNLETYEPRLPKSTVVSMSDSRSGEANAAIRIKRRR